VRLPLASLTVAAPDADALAPFVGLIAEEVNVRAVTLTDDVASAGRWVLSLVASVLGPRAGADVQRLIRAVRSGSWERHADGSVSVLERVLGDDEYTLRLVPTDDAVSRPLGGVGGLVVLDVTADPELEAEGTARDVIREVQVARREGGLHVSDRISLAVATSNEVIAALRAHLARLTDAVLAADVELVSAETAEDPTWTGRWDHIRIAELDGTPVTIAIRRHRSAGAADR